MNQPGFTLQKIGAVLLATALLLAAILALRQTIVSKNTTRAAVVTPDSSLTSLATTKMVNFNLPPLPPSIDNFANGIPRLINIHTTIPEHPRFDISTYVVQPGDNLFKIAEKYNLRPETILWGNYEILRDNPQFLRPGQELVILPTDGVYYQWDEGNNLQSIASYFRVEPDAILDYPGNRIFSDLTNRTPLEIAAGTWLIIPGGKRDLKDWGPPAITRDNPAAAAYYGAGYCGNVYEGSIGTGAFIWPTVATYLSGNSYSPSLHPGIDIAGAEGNAVFATDSGVVVYAGWSEYGYGYLIVLDHGNGWQSAYAHLSAVNVGCGESVAQGRVIGAVGSTGNSTGAHLHFELRSDIYGKVNPWDFVSP